ncbi:hypothetical protein A5668_11895 [Mycolicibacterium fortuitum]|nr:hypothetical protein A5668_11895 [Mycolicibacterium fortuitum]
MSDAFGVAGYLVDEVLGGPSGSERLLDGGNQQSGITPSDPPRFRQSIEHPHDILPWFGWWFIWRIQGVPI